MQTTGFDPAEGPQVPTEMKEELCAGIDYLMKMVNRHQNLDRSKVEAFGEKLMEILSRKYTGHWYPESPVKGQAYRCIRINRKQQVDDCLLQACESSGLQYSELALPKEMSLWIDPKEVSCRLGENSCHFQVRFPEVKDKDIEKRSPSEQETSDYHSEGSDSQADSSDDDESTRKKKEKQVQLETSAKGSTKQRLEYFYHPAQANPVFLPFSRRGVSLIPTYQPVTLYYIYPKLQKFCPQPLPHARRQKQKTVKS
ncbi:protein BTG3 [Microcaecilia unicolor]|uniref:Protein BTG3-like n=1 Tax=Microcaecilia unicolor TaxID=1415580 RepID=A0A6P7YX48_9AMPH|nr:protein BTG3-like [Microcaecilia unicolor]